ncbi:MAG: DegT/DnrJ/EryC1/StrS family aminotransferase [Spirochaetaceae bacterium]|nr:MAG: DegT/DnrJ/EryC1/StrS family aminotransferase [Spirochaetaceae bacterium]
MLAICGGTPTRDAKKKPWPTWPVWGERERREVLGVLESGTWSYNGPRESAFNHAWQAYTGSRYSCLVANGTVAIQLALEALDIGYGDEVIVPGLTWQATAAAVIDVNAVPILVDVDRDSWCISPAAVEAAITERTRAIIPVHLYGSMADMDAIMAIADRHDLFVIEDSAHKHGAVWDGKHAGTIGHIGCFSLQLSKGLTAGEGGIVNTNDRELWRRLDALRNCGRVPQAEDESVNKGSGFYQDEGHFVQSGNFRATEFQAAVLLGALERLPEQNKRRDENALFLGQELEKIPGIEPVRRDRREEAEAYFNFAFSYDQDVFGGLPVGEFREALSRELGLVVASCYEPLNDCALYQPHTKKRHHLNEEYWSAIDPTRFTLPVCESLYRDHAVTFHHSVLLGSRSDMSDIVEAVNKIHRHQGELKDY